MEERHGFTFGRRNGVRRIGIYGGGGGYVRGYGLQIVL